jgi:hypothetical protein
MPDFTSWLKRQTQIADEAAPLAIDKRGRPVPADIETGIQTIRMLGPYTVNYNDPGIGEDIVSVAELPVGAVVVDSWAFVTVGFISTPAPDPPEHQFYIHLGQGTGIIKSYALSNGGDEPGREPGRLSLTTSGGIQIVQEGGNLSVEIYPNAGVFTQGVAEIYALIAESAE